MPRSPRRLVVRPEAASPGQLVVEGGRTRAWAKRCRRRAAPGGTRAGGDGILQRREDRLLGEAGGGGQHVQPELGTDDRRDLEDLDGLGRQPATGGARRPPGPRRGRRRVDGPRRASRRRRRGRLSPPGGEPPPERRTGCRWSRRTPRELEAVLAQRMARGGLEEARHVLFGEPSECDPLQRRHAVQIGEEVAERVIPIQLAVAIRGHDQQPGRLGQAHDVAEQLHRRPGRPVEVVEHEHQRGASRPWACSQPATASKSRYCSVSGSARSGGGRSGYPFGYLGHEAGELARQPAEGADASGGRRRAGTEGARTAGTAPPDPRRSGRGAPARRSAWAAAARLGRQSGLADPRLTGEEHQAAPTLARVRARCRRRSSSGRRPTNEFVRPAVRPGGSVGWWAAVSRVANRQPGQAELSAAARASAARAGAAEAGRRVQQEPSLLVRSQATAGRWPSCSSRAMAASSRRPLPRSARAHASRPR